MDRRAVLLSLRHTLVVRAPLTPAALGPRRQQIAESEKGQTYVGHCIGRRRRRGDGDDQGYIHTGVQIETERLLLWILNPIYTGSKICNGLGYGDEVLVERLSKIRRSVLR